MFFFYSKHLIVDIHGVVPEETKYQGKNVFLVWFYSLHEKLMFTYATSSICVTNSMVDHYKSKYPSFNGRYYVYSIMPQNLREYVIEKPVSTEMIEIIYSGNIQKWQNVDLMLATIRKAKKYNVRYTILTMEKEAFLNLLQQNQIDLSEYNIEIKSVVPSGLHGYYKKAHYGFIFRDESIVNKVANPTKLVEYLHYGITPIVLYPYIGDYRDYDYILMKDFDIHTLSPNKSAKNMDVIKRARKMNDTINIVEI